MPNMNEPMSLENKRRAEVEEHWDYPIRIDVEYLLERFRTNHNIKKFENNQDEYWNLVKKAIVITCRMSEYYREESIDKSRYKFDNIIIGGGGGCNSEYTIYCTRNVAFWKLFIGEVEIDFDNKTLSVWMKEWENEEKNINQYNGRKIYTKEIKDLDKEFEKYKEQYYYKEKQI